MKNVELIQLNDSGGSIGLVSLPVPGDTDYEITVRNTISQSIPIGFWPRSERIPGGQKRTRRALVFFEKPSGKPVVDIKPDSPADEIGHTGWEIEVVPIQNIARHSDEQYWHYYYQPCELRMRLNDSEVAFSLAMDNHFGLHRWQFVQVERLWGGPLVEAYRVGGHIYTGDEKPLTQERLKQIGDIIEMPDDTIAASVYLLLFANGTAQVTAHWINGRIYGAVGPQKGIPVVEFRRISLPEGRWEGRECAFSTNEVKLDFSPAAHLVSPEHPGSMRKIEDSSIWQPFRNTRIITKRPTRNGVTEEITVDASEHGLVQGAARSVTWQLSLSNVAPGIARFVAQPEWYAQCSEFAPFPIELKEGPYEKLGRLCAKVMLRNSVSGQFTSGAIWRYLDNLGCGAYEISMDANEGRSLFLRAYRDSDAQCYDLALRNSYFMADIATDHSRDVIHYHGDKPDWRTYSLIYMRFSGMVLGYVETGDFYLLETAESVARNYMSQHKQNWPRKGIGRDADPLNGFLLLWDYTGSEEYFEFARKFANHIALVINDEGEWLSASGVGPQMGCNAIKGSAWNGGHFLNGFTEYAMRDPEVPREWLEKAGRALAHIYQMLETDHAGYHPAASGFLGRTHWYLACRLGDPTLVEKTHQLMQNIVSWVENPGDGTPPFTGGRAHHMNNYIDYSIFYEATKDSLPDILSQKP